MVGNVSRQSADHFLIDLYLNASNLEPIAFQRTTLEGLRHVLPFDYAAWGGGLVATRSVTDVVMLNQTDSVIPPPDLTADDAYCDCLLENPGRALMFDDLPNYRESQMFQEHWRHCNAEHLLSTTTVEPVDDYVSFLSVCKTDSRQGFNEGHRQLKQELVPHLANALRLNRLITTTVLAEPGERVAIVNPKVGILSSQDEFKHLLVNELGHRYWLHLARLLPVKGMRSRWFGHELQLVIEPVGDNFLVRAQNRDPFNGLSPREQEVAALFSNGLSYREVAKKLHIAPNTSRTHIHRIYEKLGVSSKVKLVQLMNSTCAQPLEN